ncbi:hypothetical protein GCM10022234_08460 [Aeromicrobium panaciterrae]|uniref:hypothetical protein n=1 Tax=Aeromicrobium panaciterrae TaxID=363861 RepID=UPI0031DB078C
MVTISTQFNGPDRTGNGGYVAGLLAAEHGTDGPVTSMLRIPPPLGVPLVWESHDEETHLLTTGGAVVGGARDGEFLRDAPACPTPEQAAAGRAAYPGFHHHPFARCFTCGTDREEGDGLRLFTGPYGEGVTASPWAPHQAFAREDGAIDTPTMWAALDCPGGWAADFTTNTIVLGKMTARVHRRPRVGEACISVGRLDEHTGRKFLTDTALYTADGELLGHAEQVWVAIDLAAFS